MALGLAMACAFGLMAQGNASIEQYTANNGLPQNSVRSMAFDPAGYLWCTTEGGLVRFDGQRFRTWNSVNTPHLVDDRLGHFIHEHAGGLLVADATGSLYRIQREGPVRVVDGRGYPDAHYLLAGSLPDATLFPSLTHATPEGDLLGHWTLWDLNVFALSPTRWAVLGRNGLFIHSARELERFVPLPATRHRAYMWQGAIHLLEATQQWSRVDAERGTRVALQLVRGPHPASIERIYWTPGSEGVFALANDTLWEVHHLPHDRVALDPLLHQLPESTHINSVVRSADGSTILVGTSSKGLYRYTRQHFQTLRLPQAQDDGSGNSFYAMVALDSSTVLTATRWVLHEGEFGRATGLPFNLDKHVLHRDARGRIWGAVGRELVIMDPQGTLPVWRAGTPAGVACAILEEGDTTWVVGTEGVLAMVADSIRLVIPLSYSGHRDRPNALVRAANGELWYASGKGVFRIHAPTATTHVLPRTQGLHARALHRDGDRTLVGTYGQGAYVVQGDRLLRLPMHDHLELSQAHAFVPDTLGNLWIPTNRGLFRMRRADLDHFLADTTFSIPYAFFGQRDGILTLEFNGGCSPAYVRSADGHILLPTIDGLVRFRPEAVGLQHVHMPMQVDALWLDGKPMPVARTLAVHGWGSRVELEISFPYWGDPRNMAALYRLGGDKARWQRVPEDGRIVLDRLFSGEHSLQFKAYGEGDGTVQHLLSIHVTPPWYATWWTALSGGLLLVGTGILLQRRRYRRLQQRNAVLESRVEQRTAELQRSNAALQNEAQVKDRLVRILSHDLVAPLKAIARVGRIGTGPDAEWSERELRAAFSEMASASAQLHDNASNLLNWIKHQGGTIAVRQEHVALHDFVARVLASLAPAAAQQAVVLLNEVPEEELVITDPDLLGIILQNVVSNAIKHAPGTTVRLTAGAVGQGWRIAVADQGPGIPATALQRIRALLAGQARSTELRTGLGFVIIADMAELLGAQVHVQSVVGAGTVVTVAWPAGVSHTG
jgi:signal transduction histidine kinase/ligand-binding sensor domain-containing protein